MQTGWSLLLAAILAISTSKADDVFLRSGIVYRNVQVVDTTNGQLNCISFFGMGRQSFDLASVLRIEFKPYNSSKPTTVDDLSKTIVLIQTVTGDRFEGRFVSSDDISVTYSTPDSSRTINRNHILSVSRLDDSTPPSAQRNPKQVHRVKEYSNLGWAVPAIIGGIATYAFISSASEKRDAIDALNALNLGYLTGDLEKEAAEKELFAGLVGVASLVCLIVAFTPTEVLIEQPISLRPTGSGIRIEFQL